MASTDRVEGSTGADDASAARSEQPPALVRGEGKRGSALASSGRELLIDPRCRSIRGFHLCR